MVSVSKKYWIIGLVLLSMVLVACERPFQASDSLPPAPTSEQEPPTGTTAEVTPAAPEDVTDPGAPVVEEPTADAGQEPAGEEAGTGQETPTEQTPEETTTEPSTEPATGEEGTTEQPTTTEEQGTGGETTTNEPATETTTETGQTVPPTTTTTPAVHTVAAGETLSKIGLRYGISWVRLAEFNNLTNPNQLVVGQEVRIPGAADTPEPTPSPQTEEIYVVKAGDNLYRIGLAYGIGWVQIAEANGIVNPNHLVVGQKIKIPTAVPGPTPQFSHTVRPGDTVFRISLQYGVSWAAIAEANNLASPYVIFPGDVLMIPGG